MDIQNYKSEFKQFHDAFHDYKDKRIVLYGLGRHTIAILPLMKDYNFVGLMDRDPENVNKYIFGIPVISEDKVETIADIIIINTAEAYWHTIYNRISHLNIPIFYRNGQLAAHSNQGYEFQRLSYWQTSYEDLLSLCMQYEIISFDIFDTLVMRKVYSPCDVFRLMDLKLKMDGDSFSSIRQTILAHFEDREFTLNQLYEQMRKYANWTKEKAEQIKLLELMIEMEVIIPRRKMCELFVELQKAGKELYLVSDMYLPRKFIEEVLQKSNIILKSDNIILSGEIGVSKRDGGLWRYYNNNYVKGRASLHIGDNQKSDVINAEKEGITAFYIMKASDMLKNSSIGSIEPSICGIHESLTIGLLCAKLFEDPFRLNASRGVLDYDEFKILGYSWFGNVVFTYLLWLIQQCEQLNIEQIIFLARDGFFLMEDYHFLLDHAYKSKGIAATYLPISRRLIMIAAIEDDKSFREAMTFPYIGMWKDYLYDRFDITIFPDDVHINDQINASTDEVQIKDWIAPYLTEIKGIIKEERSNYLKLIETMKLSGKSAIVDVGYYGNTQNCLNKLLNKDFFGFYFSADLSYDNNCAINNQMRSCFQSEQDRKATFCNLHKQSLVLESFLTAPYGMIKKVDSKGNCICDPVKHSQDKFGDRVEMNEGVKDYIKDFSELLTGVYFNEFKLNTSFADILYGLLINSKGELSQKIKDSFYWDNGMVQRRESRIFE